MSNTLYITAQAGSTIVIGDLAEQFDVVLDEPVASAAVPFDRGDPMTNEQRRALFGLWSASFGRDTTQHDRHLFTKAVLGDRISDPSWAAHGELTSDQASHLLAVLAVVSTLP